MPRITQMNQQAKKEVLSSVAGQHACKPYGRAKWKVGGNIVHVRFRSDPDLDGVSYFYNINPNTLTANFELWICGDSSKYYLIPIDHIRTIYHNPEAYGDSWHQEMRVAHINTLNHKASFSRDGNTLDFAPYFCAKF
jgi:hypothetical protein